MKIFAVLFLSVLAVGSALAADSGEASEPEAGPDFSVLTGKWVRPDGGYVITIKSISPDGVIDAYYSNPMRLPFAKAQASREGKTLRLLFQLDAGGYGGSTYNLIYDSGDDLLRGIYFQAVAGKKFDVYFQRAKP